MSEDSADADQATRTIAEDQDSSGPSTADANEAAATMTDGQSVDRGGDGRQVDDRRVTDEPAPVGSAAADGELRATHAVVDDVTYLAEAERIDVALAVPDGPRDTVSLPVPSDAHLDSRGRRLHEALFAQGASLETLQGEHLPVVVEAGDEPSIELRDADADEETWRERLPGSVADAVPLLEALSAVVAAVAILPLLAVAAGSVLVGAGGGLALAVAVGYLIAAGGLLGRAALRS